MNPQKASNLEQEEVEDSLIVLDGQNGQVHKLNLTAAMIFELCDGSNSAHAICVEIASTFGVEPSNVEQDVEATLADFVSKGIVKVNS